MARDTSRVPRTMGTHLAERRRAELYSVGLYMYRGSAANNAGTSYPISPAGTGSLEAMMRQAGWRYAFLDLSGIARAPGTEWVFRPVSAREWGTIGMTIVPRDEYDAILFVERTSPPAYARAR